MSGMDDINMIETELIKNDYNSFKRNEELLHTELDSDNFFKILKDDHGFDYKSISRFIEGGVYSFNEQHDFNIVLRKLKRDNNIKITDSILFLEDCMLLTHILKFIDEETEWVLKNELSEQYKLDRNNKLFDILY